MTYEIEWAPRALHDLTEAWDASSTEKRTQISYALNDLERLLRERAPKLGESRETVSVRHLYFAPVAITYHLVNRFRTAWIVSAHVHEPHT